MKRLTLLLLLLFAGLCARAAEDNNPCLHEWGDTQYDCSTWISEISHSSLPCSSATLSALESAAEGATETGGVCNSYQVCGKCSARKDLDSDHLGSKTASYNGTPVYDENSSPRVLRTGWHGLHVSASCHTTRGCDVGIYVEGHQHELATAKTDRDIKPCYMTGRVPHESPSQVYIGVSAPGIPVGSSHYFNVNWNNPDPNGVTDGIEYFNKYKCENCSVTWTFAENARPSAAHLVEHPVPTSAGGEYNPYAAYNYLFSFPEVGDGQTVTFLKQCKEHKVDIYGWNPKQISLFPCEEGKFEYSVNSVGVDSLDYSPKDKKVYFKEVGEEDPKQKTLYVLSEIKPEDVIEGGNDARGPTPITFTSKATGTSGFPSVHPILGGFADNELSFMEIIVKENYKFPTWAASHSGCWSGTCLPDHYEFTGVSGSTTATFTGKTTGVYTVSCTCGTESEPDDPNDNYGTRTRFVHVCNPTIQAAFSCPVTDTGKKYKGVSPCDPDFIHVPISIDQSNLPDDEVVKITITEPGNSDLYEAFITDDQGKRVPFESADPEIFKVKGGSWNHTLSIRPLEPEDENDPVDKYTVKVEYGIAGTEIQAKPAEDTTLVVWGKCENGICTIGTGGAGFHPGKGGCIVINLDEDTGDEGGGGTVEIGVTTLASAASTTLVESMDEESGETSSATTETLGNSNSIYATFTLGVGPSGGVAGCYKLKSTDMNYRMLNNFFVFPGNNALSGEDEDGRTLWIKNGSAAATFTYATAIYGEETYVTGITVRIYNSTDMTPDTPPSGGTQIGETTFVLNFGTSEEEPVVNSLDVASSNTVNGSTLQRSWHFDRPGSVFNLPEGYEFWQMAEGNLIKAIGTRYEEVDGERIRRTIEVTGSQADGILLQTERAEQLFSWGFGVISESSGDRTTRYSYYDGESRRVKTVTQPDGSHTTYEYNNDGEVIKETNVTGGRTTVQTMTQQSIANGGTITDTEERVNGTLTSRSRSTTYFEKNSLPEYFTRFDENDNEYTTTTYYAQVTDFDGQTRWQIARQINLDGTESRYTYNYSGDTLTQTTKNGIFQNDELTKGTRSETVSNRRGTQLSSRSYWTDADAGIYNLKTAETLSTAFDSDGRVTETTYMDGSKVTRTYGCCGVESETDRDGIVTTYAYDDFKRLSYSVRDGITTLYSYDATGNQTSVTVKGRNNTEITTSTEYVNGEVSATVDALNNRTTYARQYAISGEVTTYTATVTNPDNSTQVTISVNGEQTDISGTAVHPQSYEYGANWQRTLPQNVTGYSDLLGREYRTVYADNSEALQYYNSKSQVVKSVTPAGRVTLYEYDTLGRQTTQAIDMNTNDAIDAADIVTTTAYGYATYGGKTVSVTTTTRSQGADSKVISVNRRSLDGLESWSTDLAGLTTHTLLERLGSGATRQTVTQPTGVKTVTVMQNGRISTVTTLAADDTVHSEVNYTYDEFDRVSATEEKDAGNNTINTTAMTYNAAGQILTQTANGQTTSNAYDVANRTVTTTQPGNRVIVQESYPTGELKRISGADTYTQEWTWNPSWGQKATLTTWKDANTPQVTTWTYNNRGFNTAKQYADNNGPTYTYDADGLMLTRTWARGVVTTYAYDNAGRQTSQSYSDGTLSVINNYNYLNQIPTLTDAAGTWNFTYNTAGKLATATNPVILNSVVNYTYDSYARPTVMELTRGGTTQTQATYGYDSLGRIATLGNGSDTLSYAYRPGMNQLLTAQWRDSQNVALNGRSYEYDTRHRLTEIKLDGVREVAYTLNDKDQRTETTLTNGDNWAYTYDTLGQLTGALKKDTQNNTLNSMSYAFDLIGNRTTATEDATNWTYASNLLNQYTQVNALVPTYDADGNMLTWNGWTYTWNGENRLVCAESGDTKVEMNYDYTGRRFEKKVYTKGLLNLYTWTLQKHEKYVYNGYKQIASYDALNSEALLKTYTWQPVDLDVPVSMTSGGDTYYYVTDGNKNVTALLDASDNRVAEYTYGPFGQTLDADGSMAEENPFRFSSEYHDAETGLVYYNYRYYCPTLGRWIKRDSVGEKGGINLYGIVRNSTINQFDLFGMRTATNTVEVFSLGSRHLSGKYSDYTIEIDTAYIDASIRHNLGSILSKLTSSLPAGISTFSGGKIGVNGYLGSGFIAEAKRKKKPNCSRWVQYIWREDNSLGPYSRGPYLELDYAYPIGAKAVDFPGDNYSGLYDAELYQKFQLYLMDGTSGEIMHTIYWSNHIMVETTSTSIPNITVTLSVVW